MRLGVRSSRSPSAIATRTRASTAGSPDGASNIEELTVQLHGIMLRRTKAEVLDLPPKIRSWLDVEVASRVARDMSEAVTELLQTISRRGQAKLAGETEAERRSRQGWIMGQLTTARNRLAIAKVRSTIPFIENALEQGEKVLVFSCFLAPVNTLRKHFGKKAVVITGEVPASERQTTSRPLSGGRLRADIGRADYRRRRRAQPHSGAAGGLQRSRLGASQSLAGRGPGLPHRTTASRQRHLHGRQQHDRRIRQKRSSRPNQR